MKNQPSIYSRFDLAQFFFEFGKSVETVVQPIFFIIAYLFIIIIFFFMILF